MGWVLFPARIDGWEARAPYKGVTTNLARVPARLGFNTGFPHPDATPVRSISREHNVFVEVRPEFQRRVA
jgi:hypothetical protein